jgi:hypothetical protein
MILWSGTQFQRQSQVLNGCSPGQQRRLLKHKSNPGTIRLLSDLIGHCSTIRRLKQPRKDS